MTTTQSHDNSKLFKNVGSLTKLCPLIIKAYSEMMVSSKTESLEYISVFSVSGAPLNFSLLGPMILSLAVLSTSQQKVILLRRRFNLSCKTCVICSFLAHLIWIRSVSIYFFIFVMTSISLRLWLHRRNGSDFIICEIMMWTINTKYLIYVQREQSLRLKCYLSSPWTSSEVWPEIMNTSFMSSLSMLQE